MMIFLTVAVLMIVVTVVTSLTVGKNLDLELQLRLAKNSLLSGVATKKELKLLAKHSNNRDDKYNFLNREEQQVLYKAMKSL